MASIEQGSSFQPFEYETSIKVLADSSNLKAVPSKFHFTNHPTALTTAPHSFPVVDFSALTAGDPHQRSKTIHDIAKACQEWGFFNVVNHGIGEGLIDALFSSIGEFFSLGEDEKKQYEAKTASDPIKCGNFNVANASNQTFTLWRDYLKLFVHPLFHCPNKPQLLSEVVLEYSEKSRKVARKLVEAVSESLELDQKYVDEALDLDSSFQIFAANYYPRCPQPDQAIGLPTHTDPGLFTFLIHNGVPGLQIEHDGDWFDADYPKNSIMVIVPDQLEIFSNGRYKSLKHRAVVNEHRERISVVVGNGPSKEAVVGPAAPLVERDGRAMYRSAKYEEYLESQLTKPRFNGRSILDEQLI